MLDPLIEQTSSQSNENTEWLDGYSVLFIYGTGAAGTNVYKLLKSKNIVVRGFVDHRNACLWPCGVYYSSSIQLKFSSGRGEASVISTDGAITI